MVSDELFQKLEERVAKLEEKISTKTERKANEPEDKNSCGFEGHPMTSHVCQVKGRPVPIKSFEEFHNK